MAAPYVPPHLRGRNQPASSTVPVPGTAAGAQQRDTTGPGSGVVNKQSHSLQEIHQYYWPNSEGRNKATSISLHASAQNPKDLTYVLLFKDANPRWSEEGIIFVKSNLEVLPVELSDVLESSNNDGSNDTGNFMTSITPTKANGYAPIAIFSQSRRGKGFNFNGWYRVLSVEFLEPQSPELQNMLEQKWSFSQHHGQKEKTLYCNTMLKKPWAVVKFEKDEEANNRREAPNIPKLGVTDLLKMLRLRDNNVKRDTQDMLQDTRGMLHITCDMLKDVREMVEEIREVVKDGLKSSASDEVEGGQSA